MDMIIYKNQYVLSTILIVVMLLTIYLTKRAITRFSFVQAIEVNRRKLIFNLSYFVIYILTAIILILIWDVNFQQFTVFISSVLAVVGIGFVAQWSILSNLTASVIIFFNHPVRIGDRIRILDKDFDLTGEVENITGFYFFMKTDEGRNISLPNNLVLQKGIEMLDKSSSKIKISTESSLTPTPSTTPQN